MPSRFQATGALRTIWLHGLVNVSLVENGWASPLYIPPKTVKKWYTDSGAATKRQLANALRLMYDVELDDDNQFDAFGLAALCREWNRYHMGRLDGYSAYQLRCMDRWKRAL